MTTASAPGKIILFGEHAVVYGRPAVATAIDKRIYVETDFTEKSPYESSYISSIKDSQSYSSKKGIIIQYYDKSRLSYTKNDITSGQEHDVYKSEIRDERPTFYQSNKYLQESVDIVLKKAEMMGNTEIKDCVLKIVTKSELPISSGLGSSGALCVALIKSLSSLFGLDLDNKEIAQMGWEIERNVQGFASGIDPFVSTYGGIIHYNNGCFDRIDIDDQIDLNFLIIHSGKNSSTKDMVKRVAELKTRFPNTVNKIFDAIGVVTEEAVDILYNLIKGKPSKRSSKLEHLQLLGSLLCINQGLLESLGVSTLELSNLFYRSLRYGALGAKLTGSGGGGCLISLYPPSTDMATIFEDYTTLKCRISPNGVMIEK